MNWRRIFGPRWERMRAENRQPVKLRRLDANWQEIEASVEEDLQRSGWL